MATDAKVCCKNIAVRAINSDDKDGGSEKEADVRGTRGKGQRS